MSSRNLEKEENIRLKISFRGETIEFDLNPNDDMFLSDVHSQLISVYAESKAAEDIALNPSDVKIMYKGKVLSDYTTPMFQILSTSSSSHSTNKHKVIRLMAMGQSSTEIEQDHLRSQQALTSSSHKLIRDDLTEEGLKQLQRHRIVGQKILYKHSQRANGLSSSTAQKYGFQRIQTLPMLPDESKARDILLTLSQDPGILACMAHHQWTVGCLSEMYPEGQVGESEICIMGLNRNKGGEILLRLRTDDLKGFRKIQYIRRVLFHELAHNVHTEHDGNFFLLMRQIEKECVEMNWTMTSGQRLKSNEDGSNVDTTMDDIVGDDAPFQGGVYRLGNGENETLGFNSATTATSSSRELRAQAAMNRLQLVGTPNKNNAGQQKHVCTCDCIHSICRQCENGEPK